MLVRSRRRVSLTISQKRQACIPMPDAPPTILFVDDDLLMHRLCQHHFEKAGYRMISAYNGREALATASRELPNLIIMDIMMPDIDGLKALRTLKQQPTTEDIPVVIVTAMLAPGDTSKQESLNAGAAGFLNKPLSPVMLLQEARRLAPLPSREAGSS